MNRSTIARTLGAAAAIAILTVSGPLAASAHVKVTPDQASAGSYTTLTFKVPTETATAGTVKLEVDLPTKTPFGSVSYEPIPGWSAKVITETLATPVKTDDGTVTEAPIKIIWTADPGVQIAPGEFQRFTISAGPIPDTGTILIPAHQSYSDGTVVDWAQATPASGEEPEHPAPALYVNDSPPANEAGPITVSTAPGAASTSASADLATGLGIGGLALGAIALVVSVFAVTRRRQGAPGERE